jgi:multidrug resistance efflux pump
MLDDLRSEISFDWVYFPPFFFTVVFGFLCAFAIAKLLNICGLSRFFWHPGLSFVAIWVLITSVIGLTVIPP